MGLTDGQLVVFAYLVDRTSSAHDSSAGHTLDQKKDAWRCGVSGRAFSRDVDALVQKGLLRDVRPRVKGRPRRIAVTPVRTTARLDVPAAVLWPVKDSPPRWGRETGRALRALLALLRQVGFDSHRTPPDCTVAVIASSIGWSGSAFRDALDIVRRDDPPWLHVRATYDSRTSWRTANMIELRYDLLPQQLPPTRTRDEDDHCGATSSARRSGRRGKEEGQDPASENSQNAADENSQDPADESSQNRASENSQDLASSSSDSSAAPYPSLPHGCVTNGSDCGHGPSTREGGRTSPRLESADLPRAVRVSQGMPPPGRTVQRDPILTLLVDGPQDDLFEALQQAVDKARGTAGLAGDVSAAVVIARVMYGPHRVQGYDDGAVDRLRAVILRCLDKGWGPIRLADVLNAGDKQIGPGAVFRRAEEAARRRARPDPEGPARVLPPRHHATAQYTGRLVDRPKSAADWTKPLWDAAPGAT